MPFCAHGRRKNAHDTARAGKPGELAALSIGECVESVVADIEDAGLREVVVCGHSMAGVIVPSDNDGSYCRVSAGSPSAW
jgi:hypothetical protein